MKYELIFLVSFVCVLIAAEAKPSTVCEPGSSFMVDCNNCKCNEEGTDMACTRKNCHKSENEGEQPSEVTPTQQTDRADESDTCTPGETFKKDCNDCTCPPSGLKSAGLCTLIACSTDGEN